MGLFLKLLDDCDEAILLALKSKEGKITLKQKIWMRLHIFFCKCCKNFTKQSSQIDISLKDHFKELDKKSPIKASDDFKAKLKDQFK